jgi:hypothetical protein
MLEFTFGAQTVRTGYFKLYICRISVCIDIFCNTSITTGTNNVVTLHSKKKEQRNGIYRAIQSDGLAYRLVDISDHRNVSPIGDKRRILLWCKMLVGIFCDGHHNTLSVDRHRVALCKYTVGRCIVLVFLVDIGSIRAKETSGERMVSEKEKEQQRKKRQQLTPIIFAY